MRPVARTTIVCLTLSLLVALLISANGPARAEPLGPGRADQPGFSGYTTRAGHDLGIARLPNGVTGICLDTGTRRWPHAAGRPRAVNNPVVAYLLSVNLERARHDGVVAAALWWAVGREQGLNSQPSRMAGYLAELRHENRRLYAKVRRLARSLVTAARRYAAPRNGYVAAPLTMHSDGTRGSVAGLGLRSGAGRWTPGVVMTVTVQGATFAGGVTRKVLRTATTAQSLAWTRAGSSAVTVRVGYAHVPNHRYRLYRSGARYQRVAASAGWRTLAASAHLRALAKPTITTLVNRQRAEVGTTLVDAVTVKGSLGGALTGEWQLLGPIAPGSAGCRRLGWTGAPVASHGTFGVVGDGTVQVGSTRISRAGCYTYRERLNASAGTVAVPWTVAGIVEETALVVPLPPSIPRHPQVSTGGSRGTPPAGRAARPPRLGIASAGVTATLHPVAFRGSTLRPSYQRGVAGVWSAGASLSSLLGTTVIAGHVSDNADRPGVFHGLRRVKVGQQIRTADSAGHVQRWRVVRIRSYDRLHLPRSLFTQSGERRLVLITCADKQTFPGGFHYRKNLVVEAVPW